MHPLAFPPRFSVFFFFSFLIGAVTGAGHRERGAGHCAVPVSESECEAIGNAVAGYTWRGDRSVSWRPSGCYVVYSTGSVYYNRDNSGQDCSVSSAHMRCICACASGRYSNAATPPNGNCTACDAGIYLSLAVSGSIPTLSLTADSDGYSTVQYSTNLPSYLTLFFSFPPNSLLHDHIRIFSFHLLALLTAILSGKHSRPHTPTIYIYISVLYRDRCCLSVLRLLLPSFLP